VQASDADCRDARLEESGHDGGRIVFDGTPADLVARSTLTGEHLAAYVGF
jgi:excinuclease UvrABC ATPase subunit